MSLVDVLALALVGSTTLAVYLSINHLFAALGGEPFPGTRTRRRLVLQMGRMIGWWQISVGIAIVTVGPSNTGWPSAIPVAGMGCLFLAGSRLARKTGLPPWWAPE